MSKYVVEALGRNRQDSTCETETNQLPRRRSDPDVWVVGS